MTYTYDDIVTAKDILTGKVKKEDIIGKKGWFMDCIPQDMSLNVIEGDSKHYCLGHVELNWKCPFFADDGDGGAWTYFLPEKEESAPFECKEKSYEERQAEWVRANNLKPGDKVRILRRFSNFEDGFNEGINGIMENLVGEVLTVRDIYNEFIILYNKDRSNWWYWPYFVLEKVDKPAYIPFDLSKPEDRDALMDKWVKSTNPDVFHEFKITQFVRMNDDHQTIYVKTSTSRYSGNDLFYDYIFADGSPIGKLANDQQMTSK